MTENRRVLIVDDNPAVHEKAREALVAVVLSGSVRDGKLRLDDAFQGKGALDIVRKARSHGDPFSVVIVDAQMPPGWDGIETTRKLWEEQPDLQVVYLVAYAEAGPTALTDGPWVNEENLVILRKPFDAQDLRQVVRVLVAKWNLGNGAVGKRAPSDLSAEVEALRGELAERKRAEVELGHAQKLEAIGRLAAGVAHEINTPIQFVHDNVRFLQDAFSALTGLVLDYKSAVARALPEGGQEAERLRAAEKNADLEYFWGETPKAVESALEGVDRVAAIVLAMREFAHPGTQKRMADINAALFNTLTVAKNEYRYFADVVTEFGELPRVCCNIGDLNQVFLNLIVNAAHAIEAAVGGTGEKGTITVRTVADSSGVRVSISDTGCGIPDDVGPKVFEPFFTTKAVGKGTGQGLAIAHAIVVGGHGGTLTYSSREGEGTTFVVTLPLENA